VGQTEDEAVAERLGREARRALPSPTMSFRLRAWLKFQRALDPLARPRPLRALRRR
jgi:hypothetical protein